MRNTKIFIASLVGLVAIPLLAKADFTVPLPSPGASVSQQIGVTDVTVAYSSPGVKGREIWGQLVKYDEVWRTGANQCTRFTTGDDISVAGKNLSAGSYCMFTVPKKQGAWEVIFNKDDRPFAAVDYEKSKDVLRVAINPVPTNFHERLAFSFADVTDDQAVLRLEWEKIALPIPLKTDTKKLALKKIQNLKDGTDMEYLSAARYLLETEKNYDLALKTIELSIGKKETWFNTFVKGDILAAKGQFEKAAELAKKALSLKDDSVIYPIFKPRIEASAKEWSAKASS